MKYGVIISPTTDTIQPGDLARELETRGFDSLWFPEHTHMPVKARKGDVPDSYGLTYDPFIALTWAAAASRYLLLGTGICLMAQRDPIITAKTISTLDQLSRGRVRIGVGGGWNRPEMENHGVEFSRRWNSVEEKVCAMKEIWTHQPASFEGEQIQFEPMVSGPKPFQDPHPPVFMGATGKEALERVVRYCDGWIPLA